MKIRPLATLCVLALLASSLSCTGADSPTAPASPMLRMLQAQVTSAGSVLNGTTVPMGHANGAAIRFQATLTGPADLVRGASLMVRYERPGGMMMNRSGEFHLYDDGTHGDPIAHDGIYCFEDLEFQYGCGGPGVGPGQYHYDFFGVDQAGHQTDHMMVTVTVQ